MIRSAEKNLVKNTFWLYIMQICGYVFPLFTFPYLTRILTSENYGIIVFSNAIMTYFQMFLEFGFILSATNECSLVRDDKSKLSKILYSTILAKVFLVIIGWIILFFCCTFIPKLKDYKFFYFLSYIGVSLTIFLPDFLFLGIEKMEVLTCRVILSKFVYTFFIFLLVHNKNDYIKVPVATIIGNIFAIILTWYEIIKKLSLKPVKFFVKDIFLQLKKSSVFFLSRCAVSMYTSLNTVLLGFNFSSKAISQYGSANTLISSGRSLLSPISDSIYPYMVKNKNYKLVKKILLILEPIIILGCTVLFFIAPQFIKIICGNGYSDAVPVFRAMLPLIVISLPTYLFGYPLMGALGILNIANLSVIIGSVFHILGLVLLFVFNSLNFISVSILTFLTEIVVFSVRVSFALKKIKQNQSIQKENK